MSWKAVRFLPIEYRDSVRPGHPEAACAVFLDVVDAGAGEAIGDAVMRQAPIAEAEEAIVSSADPQACLRILVQRPDFVLAKRPHRGIVHKDAVAKMPQSQLSTNP